MIFKSEPCGNLLIKEGFWAYYAFETARDMLLKKSPQIIKVFTNAGLLELSKLFPSVEFVGMHCNPYLRTHCLSLLALKKRNVLFYISDYPTERIINIPGYTEIEKEAIKRASKYAIFTANSFFYSLKDNIFYDPLDSYVDLKKGIIKTIFSNNSTISDLLYLAIKATKIYSETGFVIDDKLIKLLKNADSKPYCKKISEEIAEDFKDIFTSKRAYESLCFLNEWGVLDKILPELSMLKNVNQDKDHHPEGNAFWHTLKCLRCVKKPNKNLMISVLLHDIGKAPAETKKKNNTTFPDHSSISKIIAKKILKRFYFSKEDIDEVLFLIENHMIFSTYKKFPKNKIKKIFSSPYFQNLLELYRADLESGYHSLEHYYEVARFYRDFIRKERLIHEGIYA